MSATCETCPWWQKLRHYPGERSGDPGQTVGQCRKRLPTAGWPGTNADDWCGEHPQRKETP